jgi:hypothetical protein
MSVKIAVRVRPFNEREKERESHCVIDMVIYSLKLARKYNNHQRRAKSRNFQL